MKLPALHVLAAEYREAALVLGDMDCDPQTVADTLEGLGGTLEKKAINVAAMVRNLEALAAAMKEAERRMKTRREQAERRAEHLRGYLKGALEYAKVLSVRSPELDVAIRKNPPSVVIDDATEIPELYWMTPPPPDRQLDRHGLADALKAGVDVPGAHLDRDRTRLEIK